MSELHDRLGEIKARADAATAGPWFWNGNTDTHHIMLSTKHSGLITVMDFVRWGMQQAQPRFGHNWSMKPASELPIYQVAPSAKHRHDPEFNVYRADLVGIRHPDAEFIAAARTDVDYLLGVIDVLMAKDGAQDE